MSGDETEGDHKTHPPQFRRIDAEWMSLELRMTLHRLDDLYREDWQSPGGGIRATSGNPPRIRFLSGGKVANSVAPKGLAKNCYSSVWLKNLKRHELIKLRVRDEIWDLSIPEGIDVQSDDGMDEDQTEAGGTTATARRAAATAEKAAATAGKAVAMQVTAEETVLRDDEDEDEEL